MVCSTRRPQVCPNRLQQQNRVRHKGKSSSLRVGLDAIVYGIKAHHPVSELSSGSDDGSENRVSLGRKPLKSCCLKLQSVCSCDVLWEAVKENQQAPNPRLIVRDRGKNDERGQSRVIQVFLMLSTTYSCPPLAKPFPGLPQLIPVRPHAPADSPASPIDGSSRSISHKTSSGNQTRFFKHAPPSRGRACSSVRTP